MNFQTLERVVQHDAKERYHLLFEPVASEITAPDECWWIRANQGHTLKVLVTLPFLVDVI